MKRRLFICGLAAQAAVMLPRAVRAQNAKARPIIGFLGSSSEQDLRSSIDGLRLGIVESGYSGARDVEIVPRWSDGHYDSLGELARQLVGMGVSIVVAGGLPAAIAAKATTSTIPIVFIMGADPVALGIVESLNRPGGNITGVSQFFGLVGGKRFELLCELVPGPGTIALLSNPKNPNARDHLDQIQAAARGVGQPTEVFTASSATEIDAALAGLAVHRVRGLVVMDDPFFGSQRDQLVALAARYSIPAIYNSRRFATAGGLSSYGSNPQDNYRNAGSYVGRILMGTKPADLPVLQPTAFEFVINKKAAVSLGLSLPPTLLARADEVIE
jgi:putative ABC transport system substrate-binding protein